MRKYGIVDVAGIGAKTPPDPDPWLLCQPNIPKPLHGVAPRVIAGDRWWDEKRRQAYEEAGFRCRACGAHKTKVPGQRKILEAHERYDYDYVRGRLTFVGLAALCPYCHGFIHDGRLRQLFADGAITQEYYDAVIEHGCAILRRAGLTEVWEERHNKACRVRWQDWRLVFEGKEYGPSSESMQDWLGGVWRNWKPTGEEKTVQ